MFQEDLQAGECILNKPTLNRLTGVNNEDTHGKNLTNIIVLRLKLKGDK